MRISDWSSDVCSSDLCRFGRICVALRTGRDVEGKVFRFRFRDDRDARPHRHEPVVIVVAGPTLIVRSWRKLRYPDNNPSVIDDAKVRNVEALRRNRTAQARCDIHPPDSIRFIDAPEEGKQTTTG